MAEPTKKDPVIESFLNDMLGQPQARTEAIRADVCVPMPIGCGKSVGKFRDDLSRKEYTISGLCQTCQDFVFGM